MSKVKLGKGDYERLEQAHLEVLIAEAVRGAVAKWLHRKYQLADNEAFDLAEGQVITLNRPLSPKATETKAPDLQENPKAKTETD